MSDLQPTDATKRALDPVVLPQTCHRSPARSALCRQEHPQQDHDSKNDNSLNPQEPELESIDMPPHINFLPTPLRAMASEWLIVKDLLALRTVNRSFRELSKDEYLWKKLACFLWASALVDAESSSLADESSAHLHDDAPGKWCQGIGCAAGLLSCTCVMPGSIETRKRAKRLPRISQHDPGLSWNAQNIFCAVTYHGFPNH